MGTASFSHRFHFIFRAESGDGVGEGPDGLHHGIPVTRGQRGHQRGHPGHRGVHVRQQLGGAPVCRSSLLEGGEGGGGGSEGDEEGCRSRAGRGQRVRDGSVRSGVFTLLFKWSGCQSDILVMNQ